MARRRIGAFELYDSGASTCIRASGAGCPNARFPVQLPQLISAFHIPKRPTFQCLTWDCERIISEGWDVDVDSEEGHYLTFRCWTFLSVPDHSVDIRAHATARAGLVWVAIPGDVFFTRGLHGIIPGIWARPSNPTA